MNQREQKNNGTTETKTVAERARRNFLKGGTVTGAAAVIGAISGSALPAAAQADRGKVTYSNGDPAPIAQYNPNESLMEGIRRAWYKPGWRNDLFTFNNGKGPAEWDDPDNPDYSKTKNALKNGLKLKLDNSGDETTEPLGIDHDKPVVLSFPQYQRGYQMARDDEIVFVLPNVPGGAGAAHLDSNGDTARSSMAAVPFGM